jgi:glutamine cyclotransferase
VISGIAVNANQWYRLEIHVKVDTPTTGEVKCWINGSLVLDQTGINNTEWLNGVQYLQFGEKCASPLSGAHHVYVDDVKVASSYIP